MISQAKQKIKARILFIWSYIQFKYFINKNRSLLVAENNTTGCNSYIIVLSPWLLNTTPWFSILIGLFLYKRKHNIKILVDDLLFEDVTDQKLQIRLIKATLSSLKRLNIGIEYLSSYESEEPLIKEEEIGVLNLAFANSIHKNRGEDHSDFFKKINKEYSARLKQNFPNVKEFIRKNQSQCYILPGGIYANTGLFEYLLRKSDLNYFTYDSGFSVLLSTYRGIAAQFTDIPKSLELLLKGKKEDIEHALNFARDEFDKRKNGTNKLNSQYQSYEDSKSFDNVGILIPLNSPWDSAALNIPSLFNTYNEWLLESIQLILDHSEFNVTIRQHPDERFWWGRTKTDFNQLIKSRFDNRRIQFVSCYDKVNSYALLDKSNAVICYSSTFGIEASMYGKHVCVCSNVYYSDLGFSYKPKNNQDVIYFLENIYSGSIKKDEEKASLTYYLGQKCNWLFTTFAPSMPDFRLWYKSKMDKIEDDESVVNYLKSLEEFTPVSYINHLSNCEKE